MAEEVIPVYPPALSDPRAAVQALLRRIGFGEVSTRVDIEGRARCTGGRLILSL